MKNKSIIYDGYDLGHRSPLQFDTLPNIYASITLQTIGTDYALDLIWCRVISWTNDDLLSVGPIGTNLNEIYSK